MKKIIFGIFAHPDDEAFGPAGALLKETKSGSELHLITFTNGGGGTNPDNLPNLGEARLQEWQQAGDLFGAKSMRFLGYEDGHLDNQALLTATEKISQVIATTIRDEPKDTIVEFVTMDLNGVTGHIDHIVASRATCLVFYRMKALDTRFTRVRLACWPHEVFPATNTDWVYMEPGRRMEEIDETVDAREFQDELRAIVRTHHTQRHDGENFLAWQGSNLGMCSFIVKS